MANLSNLIKKSDGSSSPVTFRGNSAGTQVMTAGVWTVIDLDTDFDTNSSYDESTNTFQPAIAGYYDLIGQYSATPTGTSPTLTVRFQKNGVTIGYNIDRRTTAASTLMGEAVVTTVYMNGTTDSVEFQGKMDDSDSTASPRTNFSANLIGSGVAAGGSPRVFKAYNTTDQNNITSAWTKITLGSIHYDTGSDFDTTNSQFNPSVAGYYQLNAAVRLTADAARNYIGIRFFDGTDAHGQALEMDTGGTASMTVSISNIHYFNGSTDYIQIETLSSGATGDIQGTIAPETTWFSGSLLTGDQAVNAVAFKVWKNLVNQTGIVADTFTKVTFELADFDDSGSFNLTTDRFEPTQAGYYNITFQAYMGMDAATGDGGYAIIYKNGVSVSETSDRWLDANLTAGVSVTDTIYLNGTTDYLEFYTVISGAGGLLYGDIQHTYVSGHLIGGIKGADGIDQAPEGTAVLSTGETGFKALVADGDDSSSWQAVATGAQGALADTALQSTDHEFVATGTINAGDTVALNSDGTVSIIENVAASDLGAGAATGGSGLHAEGCQVDTDKIAVVSGNGTNVIVRVGTIGIDETTITFGSNQIPGTGPDINTYCSISKLDTNKIVVAWRDSVASHGVARVGTITGTDIAWGATSTFYAATAAFELTTCAISTDKFLVGWDGGRLRVGTASGTTLSWGTQVTTTTSGGYFQSALIDTNKVAVSYQSSFNVYCTVCTISGTTITQGTQKLIWHNVKLIDSYGMGKLATNKMLFVWDEDAPSNGSMMVASVSGTTVTVGTRYLITDNQTGADDIGVAYLSEDRVAVLFTDGAQSSHVYMSVVTALALVPTEESTTLINAGIIDNKTAFEADTNKVGLIYGGTARIYSEALSSNNHDYVGISTDTFTNGQTGSITIGGGINALQTGLVDGSDYYVNIDGVLVTDGAGDKEPAGKALSDTEIQVIGDTISIPIEGIAIAASGVTDGFVLTADGTGSSVWEENIDNDTLVDLAWTITPSNTTTFTAVESTKYMITAGTPTALTITLPAAPTVGSEIKFADGGVGFANYNLTIARNGNTIMGLAEDLVVATNNESFGLVFTGSDWRVV